MFSSVLTMFTGPFIELLATEGSEFMVVIPQTVAARFWRPKEAIFLLVSACVIMLDMMTFWLIAQSANTIIIRLVERVGVCTFTVVVRASLNRDVAMIANIGHVFWRGPEKRPHVLCQLAT